MHKFRPASSLLLALALHAVAPSAPLSAQDDTSVVVQDENQDPLRYDTRIVPVDRVRAADLESTLRQFLQEDQQARQRAAQSAGGRAVLAWQVTVKAHPATNVLILSGPARRLDEVGELIAGLDVEPKSPPGEVATSDRMENRLIRLEHIAAERLEGTLRQFVQETESARRRNGRGSGADGAVTVRAHGATNALILFGSPRRVDEMAELVAELDVESAAGSLRIDSPSVPVLLPDGEAAKPGSRDVLRVVPVQALSPSSAASTLQQLLGSNDLRCAVLGGSGSMVLRGAADRVAVAAELLRESDRAEAARIAHRVAMQTRVLPLEHLDADVLVVRLRPVFAAPQGQVSTLTLSAVPGRLVARGRAAELEQLSALVAELDVPPTEDR